ncbi:non-hydrolyzing UDP-N-acetylglucosamine 2-epimerase [Nonomuraea sp. NPDC047897]|uniref:non-hydrolyzing UDP-N-acetylglucosamine 2-epimerase n=1 Tax=Nonomuraea sp. NPDC047897 TaxID=3364346 RepID=UPI00371F6C3E
MRRVMVVYGTRPEAIKVAPLVIGLMDAEVFEPIVVVTGQHRQLLDQVHETFGVKPDADLRLMRPGQTLAELTSRAVCGLDTLVAEQRPDAVVVQGDTTTTLAGALAAFYHRVPVVHLEAGLRSGDLFAPFPEEANRSLTSRITSLHLAPTAGNAGNLMREGVPAESIVVTGNTVIDALLRSGQAWHGYRDPRLASLERDGRRVIVVTAHRRESWGHRMEGIGRALSRLAARERDVRIVFPMHPNPALRRTLLPWLDRHPNITVTEPLHYGDFARLLHRSYLVLTDSGGIQEEAPSLGKPVLVMRDTTERPEAVRAGAARLVGTGEDGIVAAVTGLLRSPEAYRHMARARNPYGDGRATERALAALAHLFGLGPHPAPFRPDPGEDEATTGRDERALARDRMVPEQGRPLLHGRAEWRVTVSAAQDEPPGEGDGGRPSAGGGRRRAMNPDGRGSGP